MIYKNIEIHNVAELINNEDGSVSWKRVPSCVSDTMEAKGAENVVHNSTGVELRFVIKGECAKIIMSAYSDDKNNFNSFHVYYGSIQGGWQDHEVHKFVGAEPEEFVIEKPKNTENLKKMTEFSGSEWDCEVVRIIFDRGRYKIFDVIGEVEPPKPEQCPKKTMLSYGSSITHGSNSIDMSHSWVSMVGHRLGMDVRNLGMAGSCAMEEAMAEYIASEGEKGKWDIATLELGINVLTWEEEKIRDRVSNIITQVASRNPEKTVFVISPFYYCGEDFENGNNGTKWRRLIEEIVNKLKFSNVTYINGLDAIDNMSYISADEVHPNIYGVERIADVITEKIKNIIY